MMTSSVRPTMTATTTTLRQPQSASNNTTATVVALLVAATSAVVVVSAAAARVYYYKKRKRHHPSNTDDSSSQQEERYRIVLETIQQRRSIYPKQYYNYKNDNHNSVGVPRAILDDMLEAARWAPTHHLTQPWYFIVFDTLESRQRLGTFMAQQYQHKCTQQKTDSSNKPAFSQAKYDKKLRSCTQASYVIAVCLKRSPTTNHKVPVLEEVCSVAMAVQNMHLVASTAQYCCGDPGTNDDDSNNKNNDKHYNNKEPPVRMVRRMGVGAYWSTSGIYHNPHDDNNHTATATTTTNHQQESSSAVITNPPALVEFLQFDPVTTTCLGWFLVGPYSHNNNGSTTGTQNKPPPRGRRDPMNQDKVQWM